MLPESGLKEEPKEVQNRHLCIIGRMLVDIQLEEAGGGKFPPSLGVHSVWASFLVLSYMYPAARGNE